MLVRRKATNSNAPQWWPFKQRIKAMAHPMRKEGVAGHNAKLRKLTRHYGAADPAMFKESPLDRMKAEGPEESVGFGADSAGADARSDRPARRSMAANPLATYKRGGKVRKRATGGRTGKGKTDVNITVLQPAQAPQQVVPQQPIVPAGPAPAQGGPAMPAGPGGPGGPMNPALMAMAPGGMPPGIIPPRKRGGRVQHSDVKEDKALVRGMVKSSALKHRAKGGALKGNKVRMTAGSESGPGRLEKTHARARNAKHEHPQAV
jgi:hypothetical protein